ncbi:MAG: metal-dependent transcriptional regulator [Clostridia bacterium]|nr:metal-dependent transcriptional regulator [Clostridia bacterium]MBQ6232934.1 metal-dependent transcriptional regulator [Clostridia bacterium]
MKIMKSAEDYLETMLMLQERHGYIRSIDIAAELGVTKPSVSYATKRLREAGYISMAEDGHITLLPPGLEIAERIYERHKLLTELLTNLGVDPAQAREDACKIEHDLSVESFEAIKRHVKACH